VAVWNATHAADRSAPAGTAYDPTPGAAYEGGWDDHYIQVQPVAGRILEYEEQLPFATTIKDARIAALAQLPVDAKVVWFTGADYVGVDDCAQELVTSRTLAERIVGLSSGFHGGYVQLSFNTDVDGAYVGYDPTNVNEIWFMVLYGPVQPPGDLGCI
jgi:hypothetical protein